MGDFNEILYNWEKEEGSLRSENQINEFRTSLDMLHLKDLDIQGQDLLGTIAEREHIEFGKELTVL